mgnify:CR=1 FL=1
MGLSGIARTVNALYVWPHTRTHVNTHEPRLGGRLPFRFPTYLNHAQARHVGQVLPGQCMTRPASAFLPLR